AATEDFTVAQLRQFVERLRDTSDRDAAQQLSLIRVTERLSDEQLQTLEKSLRGERSRAELEVIAALSAFLDLPQEASHGDPPSTADQKKLLAKAAAYLD